MSGDRASTGARRGFAAVGLHRPKTPSNVGSVLRAAHCYGVALVAQTGMRYRYASTDTTNATKHLPLLQVEDLFDVVPRDCVPVAIDIVPGAVSLVDYTHPIRAYYLFGPEDGTLGEGILNRCRDRVYVPTAFCMNLAAAVNVVLYDRLAKESRRATSPLP